MALNVNGRNTEVTIDDPNMPLLYALCNNLGLHGSPSWASAWMEATGVFQDHRLEFELIPQITKRTAAIVFATFLGMRNKMGRVLGSTAKTIAIPTIVRVIMRPSA